MTAGYSGTPLPRKLGIAAGKRVLLEGLSLFPTKRANYALPALPAIALAAGWWRDRAGAGVAPAVRVRPRALAVATSVPSI